jgi:uncharacterized protein YceH (UPF0502 family)
VSAFELSPEEVRVLGVLLEKQRTTPDQYPLSLNAIRLACNQLTNRDPVVDYDEETIREALHRLSRQRFARLASGHSSRAIKYRQLIGETLELGEDELAVLTVLMLRGPQTPGELKQRTERLHKFADLAEIEDVIDRLAERDMAERMQRRPGQKEARYRHLLGADDEASATPAPRPAESVRAPAPGTAAPAPATPAPAAGNGASNEALEALAERVERLEAEVARLRAQLDEVL